MFNAHVMTFTAFGSIGGGGGSGSCETGGVLPAKRTRAASWEASRLESPRSDGAGVKTRLLVAPPSFIPEPVVVGATCEPGAFGGVAIREFDDACI